MIVCLLMLFAVGCFSALYGSCVFVCAVSVYTHVYKYACVCFLCLDVIRMCCLFLLVLLIAFCC